MGMTSEAWFQTNGEWKKSVSNEVKGPAPFYDPKDYGDETYVRVTAEEARAGKPCRVYTPGVYDMLHAGHTRQLRQAKNCFPNVTLIVGVCNNEDTHKHKGLTVTEDGERYEVIRDCRYVDIVVPNSPWGPYDEAFLNKYKVDFFCHDEAPYTMGSSSGNDIYAHLKELGVFVATYRTENVSTTDMIGRILSNEAAYRRRNSNRGAPVENKDENLNNKKANGDATINAIKA